MKDKRTMTTPIVVGFSIGGMEVTRATIARFQYKRSDPLVLSVALFHHPPYGSVPVLELNVFRKDFEDVVSGREINLLPDDPFSTYEIYRSSMGNIEIHHSPDNIRGSVFVILRRNARKLVKGMNKLIPYQWVSERGYEQLDGIEAV